MLIKEIYYLYGIRQKLDILWVNTDFVRKEPKQKKSYMETLK